MTNYELIDNYLTNRLAESERVAFEQQMKSDPALKADVEFHSSIVEGLKKARAAELKAMLNNVPVSSSPVNLSKLQLAAGLVGTAVLVSVLYLYLKEDGPVSNPSTTKVESISPEAQNKDKVQTTEEVVIDDSSKEFNTKPESKKESLTPSHEKTASSKTITTPTLDVVDPSEDLTESTPTREMAEPSKPGLATPPLEVDIDSANKKYAFHYQFVNGKVILFGSFDKNLFEILEFHGGSDSTFLYYKENYFVLDESKHEITPLEIIKDKTLLKKLKEYRNQ